MTKKSRRSRRSSSEQSTASTSVQKDSEKAAGSHKNLPVDIPENRQASQDPTSKQEIHEGERQVEQTENTEPENGKKSLRLSQGDELAKDQTANEGSEENAGTLEESNKDTSIQQDPENAKVKMSTLEVIPESPETSENVTSEQRAYGGAIPKTPTSQKSKKKKKKKSSRLSQSDEPAGDQPAKKESEELDAKPIEKSSAATSIRQDPEDSAQSQTSRSEDTAENLEASEGLTSKQDAYGGARPKVRAENLVTSADLTSKQDTYGGAKPKIQTTESTKKKNKKKKKKSSRVSQDDDKAEDKAALGVIKEDVESVMEVFFKEGNPPRQVLKMSTNESFSVGDSILESFPLVHVLHSSHLRFRCDWCLFRRKTLTLCDNCAHVSYCSVMCKTRAWDYLHKYECERIKDVAAGSFSDYHRCLALLVMLLQDPESSKIADQVGQEIISFEELNDHEEEFSRVKENTENMYDAFKTILAYLGEENMVSFERFKKIFARFEIHSVGITSGIDKVIGTGLYLGLSALPHKCCPPSHISFAGPILRIKCTKELEKKHIGFTTINRFTCIYLPGEERRKFLKQKIFIDCKCDDCKNKDYEEKSAKTLDRSKQRNVGTQIAKIIKQSKGPYPPNIEGAYEVINELEKALNMMDKVYGPQHIKRLEVMHLLSNYLFDVSSFTRCAEVTRECMKHHRFHFGDDSPGQAIYLFRLAHIDMFTGPRNKAKDLMTKGIQLVGILYGLDHPFYQRMSLLFNNCKEAHWRVGPIMKECPRNLYDY